jgi:hypothetical protein
MDEIQEGKWDASIAVEFGSPLPEASASGTPRSQPFAVSMDPIPIESDEEAGAKSPTPMDEASVPHIPEALCS